MRNDKNFGLPDVRHTPPIPGYVKPPRKVVKQTCESCVFILPIKDGSYDSLCRRYPPSIVTNDGKPILRSDTKFPVVCKDGWCGEYREEEVKIL